MHVVIPVVEVLGAGSHMGGACYFLISFYEHALKLKAWIEAQRPDALR
jgi:hypothetical protein